jgi:hypothetical protein
MGKDQNKKTIEIDQTAILISFDISGMMHFSEN